jgi:hypothetical protein
VLAKRQPAGIAVKFAVNFSMEIGSSFIAVGPVPQGFISHALK